MSAWDVHPQRPAARMPRLLLQVAIRDMKSRGEQAPCWSVTEFDCAPCAVLAECQRFAHANADPHPHDERRSR